MTEYVIRETSTGEGVEMRGGARDLWSCKAQEAILSGPADTGKTFAALHRLDALMWKYPRSQAAIVRKTQKSLYGTVCQTYELKVANMKAVSVYGGTQPERYIYPNGSIIWLGGMDNPDKVLSSERDFIYVNQSEELLEGDWETLLSRASGRAGNAPYAQIFGDCNPGGSRHWIRQRAARGDLVLFISKHRDNPTIYDQNGNLTESGKNRMRALASLTGIRRKRLYEGLWATAEGAVYDNFDATQHVCERDLKDFHSFGLALDEGYTNPAVILLIGEDSDGRLHVCREYYERGKLQADIVEKAKQWYNEFSARICAVDASAAGLIADLRNSGVAASPAKGRVLDGIQAVQNRLQIAGDGRPRLTVSPDCTATISEFESYVWRPQKDEPVKENDHAMDAIRYYLDANTRGGWLITTEGDCADEILQA